MPSNHYRDLTRNAQSLRKHLLPAKFDPTGKYRERVFTGVIAFRVLCHAAVEDYFETRTIEVAKSALSQCRTTGKVSLPALALLGFSGREHGLPPYTIDPPEPSKKRVWPSEIEIKQRLNDCVSSFIQRVSRENHGVREKNILSMLIPIGVDPADIDRLFLSEIDNFGMSRGDYAHKAPAIHTAKRPDPKDEVSKVRKLLDLIGPIDKNLDSLLALTKAQ